MTDSQSTAVHTFARGILISLSEDETLLPKYVNLSTNFREPPFKVEMPPFFKIKNLYTMLCPHSRWGQSFLLFAPVYAVGIQLG